MIPVTVFLLQFFITSVLTSSNSTCKTPNNESARCIPINSCDVIFNALLTGETEAINFAKQSQCGYDLAPLVCCGTTGLPIRDHHEVDDRANTGDPNLPCTTPYGELARCIPVHNCSVVLNAIQSGYMAGAKFAQQSQCGYESEPLVCCGTTGVQLFDIFDHRLLADWETCGIEKSSFRIYGGNNTDIDEFPWLALLRYINIISGEDADLICGGSLINRRYVLTAAHCISLPSNRGVSLSSVRLGEWKQSTDRDCIDAKGLQKCSDPPIEIKVQETIPHPRYNSRTRDNDIGLIRLQRNVNLNDFVYPICIPPPNGELPNVGTSMVVAGWGTTEYNRTSDIKQKTWVPLVSSSYCSNKLEGHGRISDNQFCAGGVEGKDSCQGDSGGPIMRFKVGTTNVQWIQEGVTSWGLRCGLATYPGVYTRVSEYSIWIVDNMSDF